MNNRYGRGLILAITTEESLKEKDKEIYYVQSERDPNVRYRVNLEDGTCTCMDFQKRGEVSWTRYFQYITWE